MNALQDRYHEVRRQAVKALEKIGDPRSLAELWRRQFNSSDTDDIYLAISDIQDRCKYYNHQIFHNLIPPGPTISLYLASSPKDQTLQDKLTTHLTLLQRQSIITSWNTHQILPGDETTSTLYHHLTTADIILLLISPDAIADDTCYHQEIQPAIHQHQTGQARTLPILLRPTEGLDTLLKDLPILPKNHQPITTWTNPDSAFQDIAAEIRTIALKLRQEKERKA